MRQHRHKVQHPTRPILHLEPRRRQYLRKPVAEHQRRRAYNRVRRPKDDDNNDSDGVTTPTPTQAGMVANCNKFHKVAANDQRGTIATKYSISLANVYSWNAAVGNNCGSVWLGYYCCVGKK